MTPNIRASSTDFAGLRNAGLVGILEALITTNQVATAAPTAAPTAAATGGGSTGGLLAAGTYFIKFTETNGVGETTASPESTQLTVGSTNIPRVTFPTLKTGNTARNLYLTAAGGASGTEKLFASNITTTTYDVATAAPVSTVVPPTANTTAITTDQGSRIRQSLHDRTMRKPVQDVQNYISGVAAPLTEVLQIQTDNLVLVGLLTAAVAEAAVLIAANPGTIGTSVNGSWGTVETRRTF